MIVCILSRTSNTFLQQVWRGLFCRKTGKETAHAAMRLDAFNFRKFNCRRQARPTFLVNYSNFTKGASEKTELCLNRVKHIKESAPWNMCDKVLPCMGLLRFSTWIHYCKNRFKCIVENTSGSQGYGKKSGMRVTVSLSDTQKQVKYVFVCLKFVLILPWKKVSRINILWKGTQCDWGL